MLQVHTCYVPERKRSINHSQTSTEPDQSDLIQETFSHENKQRFNGVQPSTKIKSSLCRNYTLKGYCPYGYRCQFAHGPAELKINSEQNRSYKTKTCHAFLNNGYCKFGQRCNFIHHNQDQQVENQIQLQKWSMIYSNHRETISFSKKNQRSKLISLLQE